MTLSNVKLVITDMDGTLLNSNHEVSDQFFNLFSKLKENNILFCAASGRPLYGILDKLSPIKNDILIVAENGGLVLKNDEVLLSTEIQKENVKKINETLNTIENVNAVYCTKDKAYTTNPSGKLLELLSEYYKNHEVVDSPESITAPIYKIALFHEISSEKYLYPHLHHLESEFKVKVSANHWVDISENNANKGYAVELIQNIYNISPEETMVFGDYNNDIEMLKKAHFSYAMENAHPLVKETANYSTRSNDNFGVEKILELLIKEKESS
ncbi:haloacid dehalogenase [Tenacibaculum sp. SZ-18]|uniref:HAD family hydrolase n=1 Tax=Tenacibaculum sp. SZ-18 TaxID=754423 RepID=UPI000C2D46B5|nr:HAD family hydrolase [Tenacibaculum sp. SZ-18]AUC15640.1 haloacid dehalogenase [Tenacibaculum sp. SZ-18]